MNDETLTLYYYDELSAAERREVEAALAADAGLADHAGVVAHQLTQGDRLLVRVVRREVG